LEMFGFAKGITENTTTSEKLNERLKTEEELIIKKPIIETEELKQMLLTESKLGNLNLNELTEKNIKRELELTFPKFKVQKEIGQQDGP
ncbi:hypothetical protein, partial [uncultured Aquimarina sp.]|uniref:hypothetical protein n=1 Tax=uncultured Aquimarina sp. TaxID=575652 RepID=UPI0026336FCB